MRHRIPGTGALILPLLLGATISVLFAQGAGQTQGTPGRPPTKGPEHGLFGGKGSTTKPGSHETSTKDEIDRISGKYPAPKEKKGSEEDRRAAAGTTAYVDAVAIEGERQAVTLTRDDFRVLVDGVVRRVISIHYVFRGPQALEAGRAIAVGAGAVAHVDEARTIIVLVDESAIHAAEEKSVAAAVEHVLDVVGSVDRAAVLALPQPGPLRFAATRAELLSAAAHIQGRASGAPAGSFVSFDALGQLLRDLARVDGEKQIVIVEGGGAPAPHVAQNAGGDNPEVSAVLDAAAAARAVVHVVTSSSAEAGQNNALHALARSTGGTVTRPTGAPGDLAPLATALLGGYLLEVESRDVARSGTVHTLAVTSPVHGVRVLAARRWVPRYRALPPPVAKAPPGSR